MTSDETSQPAIPSQRRSRLPRFQGLTAKQAGATLLIVILLGITGAGFQLYDTWRDTRAEARMQVARTSDLIEAAAVEAAYKVSPRLAENVVTTLVKTAGIDGARLVTNFGQPLAAAGRESDGTSQAETGLAAALFGDIRHHEVTLKRSDAEESSVVGTLRLHLSTAQLANAFYDDAARRIAVGTLRALGICVLVVGVFYAIITRPLLRMARNIAQVDPTRPGAFQLATPRGHTGDEIGSVVRALNDLLAAFQDGLDRRDAAERELTALNRDLEQRVAERTHALQQANTELEQEKAETERAYAKLERAHAELREANQQIVDSLTYAQRIQAAALPARDALGDGVADVALWWEPLQTVSGDYVWMERLEGRSLILLADCTGHGVPGAFMTLIVASALDRLIHDRGLREPDAILQGLDALVRRRLRQDDRTIESDEGLDAACVLWDPNSSTLTYAGAGIPLLHGDGAEVHEIRADRAHLGYRTFAAPTRLTRHTLTVTASTTVYLLTDGATDQMGEASGRLFGRRRLRRELAARLDHPLDDQVTALQQVLGAYRGAEPKRDDIAMLALRPAGTGASNATG